MSEGQINRMLAQIRKSAKQGDHERAHRDQDDLFLFFIEYVAAVGEGDLAIKARLVLKSIGIKFHRWCA